MKILKAGEIIFKGNALGNVNVVFSKPEWYRMVQVSDLDPNNAVFRLPELKNAYKPIQISYRRRLGLISDCMNSAGSGYGLASNYPRFPLPNGPAH